MGALGAAAFAWFTSSSSPNSRLVLAQTENLSESRLKRRPSWNAKFEGHEGTTPAIDKVIIEGTSKFGTKASVAAENGTF